MSGKANQGHAAVAIEHRLLTLCEAAEVLRLSARTVREYVKRGEIRGKIIGKRWRFKRADLVGIPDDADQCSGACRSRVPG
jgi:excisionase family DNA binding protein